MVGDLTGWARICVAGYLAGGRATLAALHGENYDVLGTDIRPGRTRTLGETLLVLGRR